MGSKRFVLDGTDWKKIGKGAVIAFGGLAVTFIAEQLVPTLDSDTIIGGIIAASASVLLNAARKFLADYSK